MNRSALIIVDMVYDFTNPNGLVFHPKHRDILPNIAKAIDICRENNAVIIFIQHCYRKDKFDKNLINMRPNCIEGSGGEAIDSSLTVLPQDYVIKKRRYSAFFGTDLDLVLREQDIRQVIIVGAKTNCCIRSTATDAYNLDYKVYVIRDCVATNDEKVNQVHLADIDKYLGHVITLKQLPQLFRGDFA